MLGPPLSYDTCIAASVRSLRPSIPTYLPPCVLVAQTRTLPSLAPEAKWEPPALKARHCTWLWVGDSSWRVNTRQTQARQDKRKGHPLIAFTPPNNRHLFPYT